MRKWLIAIIVVLVLAGCGPADDGENGPDPTREEGEPLPTEVLLPTTEPGRDTAYPPPTQVQPDAYPSPSGPEELPDPYPAGLAALILPAGSQCEDKAYPDLASALQPLEEAGVEVRAATTVDLVVCAACGCPTSEHYRVQIDRADLDTALDLGWQRE